MLVEQDRIDLRMARSELERLNYPSRSLPIPGDAPRDDGRFLSERSIEQTQAASS
jgi:hypothetical protein